MMKKKKVLVVEDHPVPEYPLKPLYLPYGAEIEMAFDACHALQILEIKKDFDLIVCNVILPGGQSGIQLVQKIEEANICSIPVFFIAPYSDLLQSAKKKNFSCYAGGLKKPFDKDLFTKALEDVFGE